MTTTVWPPTLDWGVVSSPHPGEQECGDTYLVCQVGGSVLVAVIDALGHGSEAAEVSRAAVAALAHHVDRPLVEVVEACHESLRGSRGVALTLVSVGPACLTWLAVGNVEGVLARRDGRRAYVVQRGGVVGDRLPALRVATQEVGAGDVLMLATDGVAPGFAGAVDAGTLPDAPQAIASEVHRAFATGGDDALVLATRFVTERAQTPGSGQ